MQVLKLLEQEVQVVVLGLHHLISPDAPLLHQSLPTCLHRSSRRTRGHRCHHLILLQRRQALELELRNRPVVELHLRALVFATVVMFAYSHLHRLP